MNGYKIRVKNTEEFDKLMERSKELYEGIHIPNLSNERKNIIHSIYIYPNYYISHMTSQEYGVDRYFIDHANKEISFEKYMGKKEKTLL